MSTWTEKCGAAHPSWLRQVEATLHTLKIDDMATDVQIIEGKTARIGLFKGSLVAVSEEAEETDAPKTPEKMKPQHPPMQQPQEVQKKRRVMGTISTCEAVVPRPSPWLIYLNQPLQRKHPVQSFHRPWFFLVPGLEQLPELQGATVAKATN